MRWFFPILFLSILVSCTPGELPLPPPLRVAQVVVSSEKVVEGEALPLFSQYFEEGQKALYTYVIFENVATMTGSFPVRLQWFSPNDFSPPIGMSMITMEPPSSIAEFALHDDAGMERGPYEVLVFAGENSTATGATRFFVGMTPEEASEFLKQEAEIERQMEERRASKESIEGIEGNESNEGTEGGTGLSGPKHEGTDGEEENVLPPSLKDGVGEE